MNNSELPINDTAQVADEAFDAEVSPWEEIEPGRYQPRRIRGSLPGRALG
jgi:hypothetical protein